jgi:hypothetical protein
MLGEYLSNPSKKRERTLTLFQAPVGGQTQLEAAGLQAPVAEQPTVVDAAFLASPDMINILAAQLRDEGKRLYALECLLNMTSVPAQPAQLTPPGFYDALYMGLADMYAATAEVKCLACCSQLLRCGCAPSENVLIMWGNGLLQIINKELPQSHLICVYSTLVNLFTQFPCNRSDVINQLIAKLCVGLTVAPEVAMLIPVPSTANGGRTNIESMLQKLTIAYPDLGMPLLLQSNQIYLVLMCCATTCAAAIDMTALITAINTALQESKQSKQRDFQHLLADAILSDNDDQRKAAFAIIKKDATIYKAVIEILSAHDDWDVSTILMLHHACGYDSPAALLLLPEQHNAMIEIFNNAVKQKDSIANMSEWEANKARKKVNDAIDALHRLGQLSKEERVQEIEPNPDPSKTANEVSEKYVAYQKIQLILKWINDDPVLRNLYPSTSSLNDEQLLVLLPHMIQKNKVEFLEIFFRFTAEQLLPYKEAIIEVLQPVSGKDLYALNATRFKDFARKIGYYLECGKRILIHLINSANNPPDNDSPIDTYTNVTLYSDKLLSHFLALEFTDEQKDEILVVLRQALKINEEELQEPTNRGNHYYIFSTYWLAHLIIEFTIENLDISEKTARLRQWLLGDSLLFRSQAAITLAKLSQSRPLSSEEIEQVRKVLVEWCISLEIKLVANDPFEHLYIWIFESLDQLRLTTAQLQRTMDDGIITRMIVLMNYFSAMTDSDAFDYYFGETSFLIKYIPYLSNKHAHLIAEMTNLFKKDLSEILPVYQYCIIAIICKLPLRTADRKEFFMLSSKKLRVAQRLLPFASLSEFRDSVQSLILKEYKETDREDKVTVHWQLLKAIDAIGLDVKQCLSLDNKVIDEIIICSDACVHHLSLAELLQRVRTCTTLWQALPLVLRLHHLGLDTPAYLLIKEAFAQSEKLPLHYRIGMVELILAIEYEPADAEQLAQLLAFIQLIYTAESTSMSSCTAIERFLIDRGVTECPVTMLLAALRRLPEFTVDRLLTREETAAQLSDGISTRTAFLSQMNLQPMITLLASQLTNADPAISQPARDLILRCPLMPQATFINAENSQDEQHAAILAVRQEQVLVDALTNPGDPHLTDAAKCPRL